MFGITDDNLVLPPPLSYPRLPNAQTKPKENLEAGLNQRQVFNRACAGPSATPPTKICKAIEAGDEDALRAVHETNLTLKNMWGAPPPPGGTTGCGPDGEKQLQGIRTLLGLIQRHVTAIPSLLASCCKFDILLNLTMV